MLNVWLFTVKSVCFLCGSVCVCAFLSGYFFILTFMCVCNYNYINILIYIYIYIYKYKYIYIYIYIYI